MTTTGSSADITLYQFEGNHYRARTVNTMRSGNRFSVVTTIIISGVLILGYLVVRGFQSRPFAIGDAAAPPIPSPTPFPASFDWITTPEDAAIYAVRTAQNGLPYFVLRGEPTDVRGRQLSRTRWEIIVVGDIITTIPGAPPDIPDRQERVAQLRVIVDTSTGPTFEPLPAERTVDTTTLPSIDYR